MNKTKINEKLAPSAELIDTFPNPKPNRDYTIYINIPEFTCLCPKTGQPDFATLKLEYIPNKYCIEPVSYTHLRAHET